MSLEDPFFAVKDEVFKALNKTRGLYLRWCDLRQSNSSTEVEWTTTELRNSLRSIEWDLEDLEDTICIVEKNPNKFRIDNRELISRRHFICNTRDEVKQMKVKMSPNRHRDRDITAPQPILNEDNQKSNLIAQLQTKKLEYGQPQQYEEQAELYNNFNDHHEYSEKVHLVDCPNFEQQNLSNGFINSTVSSTIAETMAATAASSRFSRTKYSRLENNLDSPGAYSTLDSPGHQLIGETVSMQQRMIQNQDEQLDNISQSIGTLKTVSRQIGVELEEQAVMLDDFDNEIETTGSKLDSTMKKFATFIHLNNDRRQWAAIFILIGLLLVLIVLFIIM